MKKSGRLWLVLFMGLLVFCVLIALAGGWFLTSSAGRGQTFWLIARPVIQIAQPADGVQLVSGQGLVLAAVAQAEAGVERVELLVDDVVAQQYLPPAGDLPVVSASFLWFSSQPGWHTLSVIVHDAEGRASAPAKIRVGILANVAGAVDSPGGAANSPSGGLGAGVENPPQAGQGAENPPLAGQGAGAENPAGEAGQAQPQDAPPEISQFEILPGLNANGGVAAVALVKARDDIGVQQILMAWHSDQGVQGQTSILCDAQLECLLRQEIVPTPGEWVFMAQAVDTSGQASAPQTRIVQVLDQPGQDPAVAVDDPGADGFSDWFLDHVDLSDLAPVVDWQDVLANLPDGPVLHPPQAGQPAAGQGNCMSVSAEPRPEGNLLTVTVECDLHSDLPDDFLHLTVDKTRMNSGWSGIQLNIAEWLDPTRKTIRAGETFTWLDSHVTCGTQVQYRPVVANAAMTNIGIGHSGLLAWAQLQVASVACAPGSLGDVNFRASSAPEGTRLAWTVQPGNAWPANLPAEGVSFLLVRTDPHSGSADILYQENLSPEELQAGGDFEVTDDQAQCRQDYLYTLSALPADRDWNLVEPGWLLMAQAHSPETLCATDDLASIPLHVEPYWFNSNLLVRLRAAFPPEFPWPQGDGMTILIQQANLADVQCVYPPCNAAWINLEQVPLTEEIRRAGLSLLSDQNPIPLGNQALAFRLALIANREYLMTGSTVAYTTPPALPPSPQILRLQATNTCPQGEARCIVIEWQPYQQPRSDYYNQAAQIIIQREIGILDHTQFNVDLDATRFVDDTPFQQGQVCRYEVTYRLIALDAEGHSYGGTSLSIFTPRCNEPWNVTVEAN